MKKNHRDRQPFPTTEAVRKYIRDYMHHDDWVIALPGYMSNDQYAIDDFVNSIFFSPHARPICNAYFAEGMNGTRYVKYSTNPYIQKIQDAHNAKFAQGSPWKIRKQRDHTKMMFFTDGGARGDGSAKIKAILLGSSNQSRQTYFNAFADKGEADIFLMEGEYLCRNGRALNGDADGNYEEEGVRKYYRQLNDEIANRLREFGDEDMEPQTALFKQLDAPGDFLDKIFKKVLEE